MPTKRLIGFAVVAALGGGCGTLAEQMTGAINSDRPTRPTISVGQPFDEAKTLLVESGAEEITHAISVIPYRAGEYSWFWFRLRDERWLFVIAVMVGEPKQLVISELVLGDKNTAHIKERGLKKYPEITRLELP